MILAVHFLITTYKDERVLMLCNNQHYIQHTIQHTIAICQNQTQERS